MDDIPLQERRRLAQKYGVNAVYLYQCLAGHRQMAAADARALEDRSNGELMRWHLRRNDWHRIWPELINAPGAPAVPAEAANAA